MGSRCQRIHDIATVIIPNIIIDSCDLRGTELEAPSGFALRGGNQPISVAVDFLEPVGLRGKPSQRQRLSLRDRTDL